MSTLVIKSGTTAIAGAIVKGNFSYFSANTTTDLGPTSSTGLYSGVDAPSGGYTVYRIGGPDGWTARVATNTTSLNSILISYGATGTTLDQRITWATNTDSVFINSGATATYTIGQSALGGKIAYILQPGDIGYDENIQKGLVVATEDAGEAEWGCRGTVFPGAYNSAIGTGQQNTTAILAGCSTAGIAARLCNDYSSEGYTDWYLPSIDELSTLYQNRVAINLTYSVANSGLYWSSTNIVNTPFSEQLAQVDSPNTGAGGPYFKDTVFNVRAMRSF
jgi:hypothetical protein